MRGKLGRFSRPGPISITSLSGLTGWWDASDSSTLFDADSGGSNSTADGAVGRIEDKSGNARHFTQATSGNRPVRKTAQQNGLDVLRFDGTSSRMKNTTFATFFSASASSAFIVAKAQAVSTDDANIFSNASVVSDGSAGHGFVTLKSDDTAVSFGLDGGYRIASLPYVPGNWRLFSTTHNGSQLAFSINNATPSTASLSTRTFTGFDLRLGSNWQPAVFFDGDVGEIIFFNVVLSASDESAVVSYLMDKWGLT